MNETIAVYILHTFSEGMCIVIKDAFKVIIDLGADESIYVFDDLILNDDNTTEETLQDLFILTLNNQLTNLLNIHSIIVNEHEITLNEKVQLLRALIDVQNLDDYSNIIAVVESYLDPIEKFSEIVSQLTLLRSTDVFRIVESVDPITLDLLKGYVYSKDIEAERKSKQLSRLQLNIINNLKSFKKWLESDSNTKDLMPYGIHMINSFVLPGQPFNSYIPYISKDLENQTPNPNLIALNILSVIYISDEYNSPIECYRNNSEKLLDNLDLIKKVEASLLLVFQSFDNFKKSDLNV